MSAPAIYGNEQGQFAKNKHEEQACEAEESFLKQELQYCAENLAQTLDHREEGSIIERFLQVRIKILLEKKLGDERSHTTDCLLKGVLPYLRCHIVKLFPKEDVNNAQREIYRRELAYLVSEEKEWGRIRHQKQQAIEAKNAGAVCSIKCPACRKIGNVDLSKHVIHGCSDPVPEDYEGDKAVCVACTEKWADVFFVGCGHNVMCQGCVRKMSAQK
jgi:hypothetical protein